MESVYYSSLIKLLVSIFLVYKAKKCLLKSGKVKFCSKFIKIAAHP